VKTIYTKITYLKVNPPRSLRCTCTKIVAFLSPFASVLLVLNIYLLTYSYTTSVLSATSELLFGNGSSSESRFPCTVGPGAGLPCWRLSAGCTFRMETPAPRSTERRVCHVPRQNSTFGDRSFAAAGPRTWNELPFSLRVTGLSLTAFNEHLKTYSFSVAFFLRPRRICDMYDLFAPCINLLTYLLTFLPDDVCLSLATTLIQSRLD